MKKTIKKIIVFLAIAIVSVPIMTTQADAASSVTISTGDKVNGGDTFYATVTFDGDNVGRVSAGLSYDTDKLTYISGGSSQGNSGYVDLTLAGTGEPITFKIKFQALDEGQTSLKVETHEMYDLDEMYMSDMPSASKTITIIGSAADSQTVSQETSPDEPASSTEPVGADEIEPRDNDDAGVNITVILIISAAILVLIIVIISVILAKKKKNGKNKKHNNTSLANKYDEHDMGHSEYKGRTGRSGRPLDSEKNHDSKSDKTWLDELMGSGNVDRHRDYSETARMKAKEETEVFTDWDLGDKSDDYDDIEKW